LNLIILIAFLIVTPFAITGWLFAPWVPIDSKDLERLGKILKLTKTDIFYELGCGDGRVVDYVAKKFKCRSIGVELNPFLYLFCKFRKGEYIFSDLFKVDLSKATCIYLFGLPKKIKNLKLKNLKPGTRIISYAFQIEGWKPRKVYQDSQKFSIYEYFSRQD
jgi:hypothetical protein